jgi:inorganic triphosphatase YgiF
VTVATRTSLTVNLSIENVRETLKAFGQMPKDANDALRDASLDLAQELAAAARADGMANGGPQGRLVAQTVKAKRDRVPVVEAGGTRRLGRHRSPAYGLVFASVFGMTRRSGWYASPRYGTSSNRQYRPHGGRAACWFFPVIEQNAAEISRRWNAAADEVVRKFSEGGV